MSKREHSQSQGYSPQVTERPKRPKLDPEEIDSWHQLSSTQVQKAQPQNLEHDIPKPPESGYYDAIATLLEHSDELIRCIASLKAPAESPQLAVVPTTTANTRQRLAAVSKQLLPAIQVLASWSLEDKTTETTSGTVAVPSHVSYTKWTSQDVPKSLPPLPEIKDATVERAALTHSATVSNQDQVRLSYDRLEWLGDAYLELFSTCFIYQTFPDLSHGKCTQIREMLIRNDNLARYTVEYGLEKRARFPREFSSGGNKGGSAATAIQKTKALGDLFEAYVGAVIVSDPFHGVSRAANWLKGVWGKTIEHKIKQEEERQLSLATTHGTPSHDPAPLASTTGPGARPKQSPKERLAQMVVVTGISLRYVDLPKPKARDRDNKLELFSIGVVLNGWGEKDLLLGRGVGTGKKEAGNKAAQMALDNKKLMRKYGDMKQAFMATQGSVGVQERADHAKTAPQAEAGTMAAKTDTNSG